MLKIRFTRTGKKDEAHYRIVVAEHTAPVLGRFIEILGHYDPKTKKTVIKKERIEHWLKMGAKPSNTVAKLLQKEGLKHKSIVIKTFKKKPKAKKGDAKEVKPAVQTPATEAKAPEVEKPAAPKAPAEKAAAPEETKEKVEEAPEADAQKPAIA
jgi:small subunit ribosomal protein S16